MADQPNAQRFRNAYTLTAVIALNTLALFVVCNLAAAAWLRSWPEQSTKHGNAWLIDGYGIDTLARNYPGMSRQDLTAFLYETSNWIQAYEPFTGFKPLTRHDRFITISADGFRPVPQQAAWPPPADRPAVFLFGGSTMMGAGVPDDSTIAAHLQRELSRCAMPLAIYNFGRGFYFSTQERILFEQLLLAGHRPALAVFLDGLNDFYFAEGQPQFTAEMTSFMKQGSGVLEPPSLSASLAAAARQLPIVRAAMRNEAPALLPTNFGQGPQESSRPTAELIDGVLGRWERNRALIQAEGQAFNVRAAFVWQPVPTYAYDETKLSVYREGIDLFGAHKLSGLGYPVAAKRFGTGALGDVLWLGDMQRDRAENLYVDAVHYTSRFSADIAQRISRYLVDQRLISCTERGHGN